MIRYLCQSCGEPMESPDTRRGGVETCPECGASNLIRQPFHRRWLHPGRLMPLLLAVVGGLGMIVSGHSLLRDLGPAWRIGWLPCTVWLLSWLVLGLAALIELIGHAIADLSEVLALMRQHRIGR